MNARRPRSGCSRCTPAARRRSRLVRGQGTSAPTRSVKSPAPDRTRISPGGWRRLRSTVACLAASVGGADAITVLPFDSALGLPGNLARRIARNTQAILHDEASLARVADPAGGSWYAERLTDQLARGAWDWFQEIERAGGQHDALRSGLIAGRIAQNWARRTANLARRREPVTGVSEFPNLGEKPVVRDPAPARAGGGLPRVHRSEAFEALRSRSDAIRAQTGARPQIVLAAL